MKRLLLIALVACGVEPPARSPTERTADTAPAVAALQAGHFDDAAVQATTALGRDPRNARAAAIRAIARYVAAGDQVVGVMSLLLHKVDKLDVLDHPTGRAAWQGFLDGLDAVDRDLAIAAADPEFSLELCLACWEHDWNHNGHIDDRDRRLFEIETDAADHPLPKDDPRRRPTFRFDVGDIDWARAMIAFQRAAVELVLAYDWSQLDKLWTDHGRHADLTIRLTDGDRVKRARERILAGVGFADRSRREYLAETDDDREWVPNPRQKNHPVPLEVDDKLYETWAGITSDVRRLLDSDDGISMRQLVGLFEPGAALLVPDAYIDLGGMLREPTDIVLRPTLIPDGGRDAVAKTEQFLRGVLGNGYSTSMHSSPLVLRLRRMKNELDRNDDQLDRKLHYLLWLN